MTRFAFVSNSCLGHIATVLATSLDCGNCPHGCRQGYFGQLNLAERPLSGFIASINQQSVPDQPGERSIKSTGTSIGWPQATGTTQRVKSKESEVK